MRYRAIASGYGRSVFLRYIEEAMAESYAQLRVHGLQEILVGIRFPLRGPNAYVTVSQLAAEGTAIGNITMGGTLFTVYIAEGNWEGASR